MPETRRSPVGPVGAAVAANVRALRKERGLSQEALAAALSARGHQLQRGVVTAIETESRSVTVDDLVAFADALGVTPQLLLGRADDCCFRDGYQAGWAACRKAALDATGRLTPPADPGATS